MKKFTQSYRKCYTIPRYSIFINIKKEKLSLKRNNPTILYCSIFPSNIIHKLQNIYGQEYAPS